jgi:hypothetical protein
MPAYHGGEAAVLAELAGLRVGIWLIIALGTGNREPFKQNERDRVERIRG